MSTRPIPLEEALALEQDFLTLSPRFAPFLGKLPADSGFSFLIFGGAGSAKSSLCLQLAAEMRRLGNVLYVCAEEAVANGTIQLRAKQLGISGGIDLLDETDLDELLRILRRGEYDFCFVDSITTMTDGDERADPREIIHLTKRFPHIGFFFVSQATKGRTQYAGAASLEHDVDASILVSGQGTETRLATIHKSRFSPTVHQIPVFLHSSREHTISESFEGDTMTYNTSTPAPLKGSQLKTLRRMHDISQEALAKRAGMDRRKISMLETSDSPLPETLVGALYGLCPQCADSARTSPAQASSAAHSTESPSFQQTAYGTPHLAQSHLAQPHLAQPHLAQQFPHAAGASGNDGGKLFYFERRCADLSAELQVVKAQNSDLQRRLEEATQEIHECEKLLSQIEVKTTLGDKLEEFRRNADTTLKKDEMTAELLGQAMAHAPAILTSITDGLLKLRGMPVAPAPPKPTQFSFTAPQASPIPPFSTPAQPINPVQPISNDDDNIFVTSPQE